MSGILIAYVNVTDPEKYKNYTALTPDAIAHHGGEFIVRGGDVHTVEGAEENRRIVVVKFDSVEKAKAFWQSPEYENARRERVGAAEFNAVIVEGA
jgi:uncharacterized protein (DUF1330 family)